MPRDYKNSFRQPPKKKWRLELISLAILIFVVAAGLFWKYNKEAASFSSDGFASWVASIKAKWSHRNSTVANAKPLTMAQKEAQHNEVHFDFYSELPKMQVGVPETAKTTAAVTKASPADHRKSVDSVSGVPAVPAPAAVPPAPAPQYIVQLATFNELASASQLRISLLLSGVEAEIVKTEVDGHLIYSVQQGPYATEALAKSSQRRLQQKGFASEVKK